MQVRVYFKTRIYADIRKIIERFNLQPGVSVNYETHGDVKESDIWLLEETARRGYIEIRK
jgi:hypothetical protein